jgi:O-antigen/teichoic acid export membrane protein
MGVFAAPFNVLLLPLIGSMVEQSGRIVRTLFRVCAYFLVLVAAPVVVFGLWPKFVIGGLYGDAFTAGAEVLPRLTIARLLGYLGVMICLFFASIDRFGFLRVYIPGLAGQVAALVFWHDSMLTVATVIMVVQAVMVTTLLALVARSFHQR